MSSDFASSIVNSFFAIFLERLFVRAIFSKSVVRSLILISLVFVRSLSEKIIAVDVTKLYAVSYTHL